MTLVPAFEIGVWNAWIFMIYNFIPMPLLMLIHRELAKQAGSPTSEIEKRLWPVAWVVWLLGVIYSIFLPLNVGTVWFYVGFPIAMVGAVAFTMVIVTFATTPIDVEPLTGGLYRYSRHPMYVTQLVMFIGVGIACASWVFLLFTVVYSVIMLACAVPEEQACLEKYGNAYREHLRRTPRWIGLPKSAETK
ncbi:MAG TPA: isoprenylcysteine carboxylmethyltransferase family protein [Dehalococcoidia bacterium]|nr:isoprenylcysteine carboxylmethyltransferase family protein [Dehalococcoidia bacterium]